MTPADRTPDDPYAASYDAVRRRLAALPLGELSGTPVPACPGWCVRDVVAHLAGLCQDWVENRFDGYASDAWTTNQVTRFRRTVVG